MKRPITSALLAAALSLSLVVPAGAVSSSTAVEAIQALGIITGDSSGDLNLSSPVTRAEFVTMMTGRPPAIRTASGRAAASPGLRMSRATTGPASTSSWRWSRAG